MHWDKPTIKKMVSLAFVSGVFSSMLGLGGGVIYNPIFVSLQLFPSVAFSTGMYLAMFTSLSNTILYALSNQLVYTWAFYQGLLSIIGAYVGIKSVKEIVARTGKDSILVFVLAFVIIGSAFIIPIQAVSEFLEKLHDGFNVYSFKGYCKK